MAKSRQILVLSETVRVQIVRDDDFISLTDIARYKNPEAPRDIIKNWMRNKNTIELFGLWEQANNPDFNCGKYATIKGQHLEKGCQSVKQVEFDLFRIRAGLPPFVLISGLVNTSRGRKGGCHVCK